MLHTLHRSPFYTDMNALLRMLKPGDDFLLIQDGVIAAVAGNAWYERLKVAPVSLFALSDDIAARGLCAQISDKVVQADYSDFVALVLKHTSQMAW